MNDWNVRSSGGGLDKKTNLPRERTHTLYYKGEPMNSGKGISGESAMRAQAAFCNERDLKPNTAGCRADMSEGARKAAMLKK